MGPLPSSRNASDPARPHLSPTFGPEVDSNLRVHESWCPWPVQEASTAVPLSVSSQLLAELPTPEYSTSLLWVPAGLLLPPPGRSIRRRVSSRPFCPRAPPLVHSNSVWYQTLRFGGWRPRFTGCSFSSASTFNPWSLPVSTLSPLPLRLTHLPVSEMAWAFSLLALVQISSLVGADPQSCF